MSNTKSNGFCEYGTKWSGISERTSYQINLQHRVQLGNGKKRKYQTFFLYFWINSCLRINSQYNFSYKTQDVDGACYLVSPFGTVEVPDIEVANMAMLVFTGKIARALGFRSLNARATCFIQFSILYLGFYLLRCVLSSISAIVF